MQAEGKWRKERMYFLYLHTSKSPYKIWGTDNLLRCWQKKSYLFPLSVFKNVNKYSVILSFSGIQKAFDFFSRSRIFDIYPIQCGPEKGKNGQ